MKARRWKTWLKHALIAGTVAFGLALVLPKIAAAAVAAGFYFFREINQQIPKWASSTTGARLGAVGDVCSAWLGAGSVWWLS